MSTYTPALHYQGYQALDDLTAPSRGIARALAPWFQHALHWFPDNRWLLQGLAACEVLALTGLSHERPPFAITSVETDAGPLQVVEEAVHRTPFCTLQRFRKIGAPAEPKVLLVAPVSGHFATLLRGTVQTLLVDHDVYVTDWHNVRDIPLSAGAFDLDAFIGQIIGFVDWLGEGVHLVAVCQPTVPTLAAVAVMAEDKHPAQPRSMTLMAGPIDCRVNPTEVNRLATSQPFEWFERNLIGVVPLRYRGGMRRVYPGFLQISAFMSMNLGRHADSYRDMYRHYAQGDLAKAAGIKEFYEEYLAMMDLPAEFYLQTIRAVFQEYDMPRGCFHYKGRLVNPGAIRRTSLFTIEGEKDDICSIGQTLAAHDLCSKLAPYRKQHHLQAGVGHYGVFNGKRWNRQIYPRIRDFIHAFDE
ncbi:MAG: polyhydroxyalkanoate depolymerase [Zoogloeaceae bacterium]|nr:polyhydroxyalkanoate depolymerase [Zoogloeaceae bacterium]